MDRPSNLLAADEAAAILHVKPGTVYDWAGRGILPHVRILAGRRRPVIRFRVEDLHSFLAERTVTSNLDSK